MELIFLNMRRQIIFKIGHKRYKIKTFDSRTQSEIYILMESKRYMRFKMELKLNSDLESESDCKLSKQ